MTHSARLLSAKKEAEIRFDNSLEGTLEGEYMIIVNNKVEHRVDGYEIAIRYIERKGYSLVYRELEETIDDYLFHDNLLCSERGSGRDKLPQF